MIGSRVERVCHRTGSHHPGGTLDCLMCGIVAVLRRPTDRPPPELAGLADLVAAARSEVDHGIAHVETRRRDFEAAAGHLGTVDAALRGSAGVRALLGDPARTRDLATTLE